MRSGILVDLWKGLSNFWGNSYEREYTKEIYLKNSRLEIENSKIKEKIVMLEKELELSKKRSERLKREARVSTVSIKNEFEKECDYLLPEAKNAFKTADYMFNTQKVDMDYSGVYLLYAKGIEIQLRSYLGVSKSTFGSLIMRLRNIEGCEKLATFMLKNRIIYMRNRGVHRKKITKQDCGKLRKIIVEEKWLEKVHMAFHAGFSRRYEEKKVKFSSYIYKAEGLEQYGKGLYRCYIADNAYILSNKLLENGRVTGIGKKVLIKGIEYIVI